jgi:ArsR family transcriptional regulator
MDYETKVLVKLFKALSDETRHRIFELLCCEEMNVSDICREFHTAQPTISHHLQILKNCDLVDTRKEGKMIYYYVNKEVINDALGNVIERFRVEIRK